MSLEKKIYSPWAFTENESEKRNINQEIYKEIQDKAIVVYKEEQATDELKKKIAVILDYKHGYAHTDYKVLSNPHNLSNLQLALICDGGNLCFEHRTSGNIITICTD